MSGNNNSYIKVDNDKLINEKCIRWIKKMDDCLSICTLSNGCYIGNTHKICKSSNIDTYNKLNKHFDVKNT